MTDPPRSDYMNTVLISPVVMHWRPIKSIMVESKHKLFTLVYFCLLNNATVYFEYTEAISGEFKHDTDDIKKFEATWKIDMNYLINNYPS